jgi:hypothetical protein
LVILIASIGGITTLNQQFTYASIDPETGNNINEEEEERSTQQQQGGQGGGEQCATIPSTDPDLKGWEIETCSDDGDQTWITPDGRRCAAGQVATMCEGSIPIAPSS